MSLVGWWKLDGNLEDSTGNKHDCTLSGTSSYVTGKISSAFNFNGSSILTATGTNVYNSGYTTMSCWVYPTIDQSSADFLGKGYSSSSPYCSFAVEYSGGQYVFGVQNGSSYLTFNYNYPINTWAHISYVLTPQGVKGYVNGVKIGELITPLTTKFSDTYYFNIGGINPHQKFTGYIDDVRLYDEALSDEEIYDISRGLVVHYTFGNDNGNTVYDNSGYGNDGTIDPSTAPTWTYDSPKGKGAYVFDYTRKYIDLASVVPTLPSLSSCTVSFWRKNPNTLTNWLILTGQGGNEYLLASNNSGTSNFYSNNCGSPAVYVDGIQTSVVPQDQNWHFITATNVNLSTWTALTMADYNSFYISGTISDFRIYATSLSASDIKSLYTSTIITTNTGSIKTLSEFNELDTINLPDDISYITANGQGTAYLKTKKIYPLQLGRDSINIPSRNYQVLTWTYGTITDASGDWKLFTTSSTGGFPYYEYSNSGVPNNFVVGELYFASVELKNISSDTVSFYTQGNGLQGNSGNISFASNESKRVSFIGTFVAHNAQIQMHSSTDLVAFQFKKPMMISITALLTTSGDSFLDILANAGYTTNEQIKSWCDTLPWINPNSSLVLGKGQNIDNGFPNADFKNGTTEYQSSNTISVSEGVITGTSSNSNNITIHTPLISKYLTLNNVYIRTFQKIVSCDNTPTILVNWYRTSWNSTKSNPVVGTEYMLSNISNLYNYSPDSAITSIIDARQNSTGSIVATSRNPVFITIADNALYSFILLLGQSTDALIKTWLDTYIPFFTDTKTLDTLLNIKTLKGYNSSNTLIPMPRLISSKRYTSSLIFNENALFDGLVAYYPLNGNANDYSGNGNNGTVNGAVVATGKNQQCYSFNGTSDYIVASPPSNGQTLSFFCNLVSNTDSDDVPLIYGTTSSGKNLMIYFRSSSHLVRIFGWGLDKDTGFIKDLNTWHLWTITSTGTEVYLYRDGIADNLNPYSASISITDNSLIIGRGNINTYSNCLIQDVRIYNRALTAQEIKIMYEVTFNRKPMITDIGVFAPKFSEV